METYFQVISNEVLHIHIPYSIDFIRFQDNGGGSDGQASYEISNIKEPMDTIFVKNVKEGSSAQLSGLTKGWY